MRTDVRSQSLTAAGLFAGIGGIELGFREAGLETTFLCEIDPHAQSVLREHFPTASIEPDVLALGALPNVDVLVGGFPCQDLSQAGRTAGIGGRNSGLVRRVFDLLAGAESLPRWLVLENVSFMLQLDKGSAMGFLTKELERLGMAWAYRVVDTRGFGLPQRRQRVIVVASATDDPSRVLFADEADPPISADPADVACGFYWTEGLRGLGWAIDAVPTLKGGSTIGIPSPPAIRLADGSIVTPGILDAERLQGFAAGWTESAASVSGRRSAALRWRLVGNAVSVPVATWVGRRLLDPGSPVSLPERRLRQGDRWPKAGHGADGEAYAVEASMYPLAVPAPHLHEFLEHELTPLSLRAASGFLRRTSCSSLRFPHGLLRDVGNHIDSMNGARPLFAA